MERIFNCLFIELSPRVASFGDIQVLSRFTLSLFSCTKTTQMGTKTGIHTQQKMQAGVPEDLFLFLKNGDRGYGSIVHLVKELRFLRNDR